MTVCLFNGDQTWLLCMYWQQLWWDNCVFVCIGNMDVNARHVLLWRKCLYAMTYLLQVEQMWSQLDISRLKKWCHHVFISRVFLGLEFNFSVENLAPNRQCNNILFPRLRIIQIWKFGTYLSYWWNEIFLWISFGGIAKKLIENKM